MIHRGSDMARIDLMGKYCTQEKAVLFQGEAMMQSWIQVLFFRDIFSPGNPETRRLVGFRLNIHLMGFNHPLPP